MRMQRAIAAGIMGRPAASSVEQWRQAISAAYYQQDVLADTGAPFHARMQVWDLGQVTVSRIRSSALTYRRRHAQIAAQTPAVSISV